MTRSIHASEPIGWQQSEALFGDRCFFSGAMDAYMLTLPALNVAFGMAPHKL